MRKTAKDWKEFHEKSTFVMPCDILTVGDTVAAELIWATTGQDPEDVADNVCLLQADHGFASNALGGVMLFETFKRETRNDAWQYAGLCMKNSYLNMSPEGARRVFIISDYTSDRDFGIKLLKAACYEHFSSGDFPVAPHLYFSQFMHVDIMLEKEYAIAAGHQLMRFCTDVEVLVVDEYISDEMRQDIDFAINQLAIQPIYRKMTRLEAENI